LPPILEGELAARRMTWLAWYWGIGPACLGIVVWAPFYDQLWASSLGRHSLAWLAAAAIVALVGCYALFYQSASWGYEAGRPLGLVAASTFGTIGSEWITGIGLAAGHLVWYTVAVNFALDATFLGLRACGLLDASTLASFELGAFTVKSPLYLCTAIFWIFITRRAVSLQLPGVVVALMRIYAPFALLLLSIVGIWNLPSVGSVFAPVSATALAVRDAPPDWRDSSLVVPLVLGFFTVPCLTAVDWGQAVRRRRDIMFGGLPTILVVGSWAAIMSLVVVTAAAIREAQPPGSFAASGGEPLPFSFRWAILRSTTFFPRGVAPAILILFGLAALAPAVACLNTFARKVSAHWPRIGLDNAAWFGGTLALVFMATGGADRSGPIFTGMGVVFGPVLGAMAGDRIRSASRPRDIRLGVNPAGIFAWGAGFLVAAAAEALTRLNLGMPGWLGQTSILGFVAAGVTYGLLARVGLEPPSEELVDLASGA
jgi:hypothetical protein